MSAQNPVPLQMPDLHAPGLAAEPDRDGMNQWRERFLVTVLRLCFVVGVIVGGPSMFAAARDGLWPIVVLDSLALAGVFVLWHSRTLSYRLRSVCLVGVIYVLGAFLLAVVGPVALVYLMAFPIMVSVLLGMRPAILALVLNAATLLVVGSLANPDLYVPGLNHFPLLKWLVITLNFSFADGLITIASALTVRRLEESLRLQQLANQLLLEETAVRQRAEEEVRQLNAQLEERVRRRTAQLESANAELQSFSYAVSHDLRAPLATIDGFGSLVERHILPESQVGRHYIARIRAATRQMGDLIDAMLLLAQVSRTPMRHERMDLSEMAGELLTALQERQPARKVSVRVQPRMHVPGDARLMRQVLENLLGNAWKFTGGTALPDISFSRLTGPDGTEIYTVRDNGAGFDMAHASRLFGAFQRLHSQLEFEGTGIGLATVHKIVTRHGGRVWAESSPGQGAAFHFTLASPAGPPAP